MKSIERVQAAADIGGVAAAIYSASRDKSALAFAGAVQSLMASGYDGIDVIEAKSKDLILTAQQITKGIESRNSGSGFYDQVSYALGAVGLPGTRFSDILAGIVALSGTFIGRTIATHYMESESGPRDADGLVALMDMAVAVVDRLAMPMKAHANAMRAITTRFETAINAAQLRAVESGLDEALASINPDGGKAEVQRVVDMVKTATQGMSPERVSAIMRSGVLAKIDKAAEIVGQRIIEGVGPDKLPASIAAITGKLRPQEVIVGKIKATGTDEFKAIYSSLIEKAKDVYKPALSSEFQTVGSKRLKEVSSQYPNRWQEPEEHELFLTAKKQLEKELYSEIFGKLEALAQEKVAQEAGVTVQELQSKLEAVDAMARDLAAERGRVGQQLLAEIQAMGISKGEAEAIKHNKVVRDPSLRTVLSGHDYEARITDFLRLVGKGVIDAGPVQIMSAAALKKQHPALYRENGVQRAFCTYGYHKTATGGDDVNAIGMGTKSRDITTLWHEKGHWLEHNNPVVRGMVQAWFKRRTAGEKPVKLKNLFPNSNYRSNEITLRDKFLHPYMGKVYETGSTEIVSMGMEYLSSPETAAELAAKDPDMMALMVKIIEVVND